LVTAAAILALVAAADAASWKAARTITAHDWYAAGTLTLAEALIASGLSPARRWDVRHGDGRTETVTLGAIAGHAPLLALRGRMIGDLLDAGLIGLGIAAGLIVTCLLTLRYTGRRLKRGRRLRGGELVSAGQFRRRVSPIRVFAPFTRSAAQRLRIAGVPYPEGAETRHTIVSGTTGSGKTVLIADLVEQSPLRQDGELHRDLL